MADLKELYNFGQRGIDTQVERDLINYDPTLEYIKRISVREGQKLNENYVPSREMDILTRYNIPAAKLAIKKADDAIKKCLEALKRNLIDIKVLIKDQFKEREALIKAYCGGDYVTFEMFDKACRDDSKDARLVMFYYMEKADKMEALAYPDIVLLDKDNQRDLGFVDKDLTSMAYAYGYDSSKTVEEATDDMVAKRYGLELRLQELQEVFRGGNPTEEDYAEYDQISSDLAELDQDTTSTLSKVVMDRADNTYDNSETIYGLTMQNIADILGGSQSLEGLIMAIGNTDPSNPYDEANKLRNQIAQIKKIVAVANALSSLKSIELTDLILMILSPIIREVTNQLISAFSQIKVSIIKPPLEWLDRLSDMTVLIPMKNSSLGKTGVEVIDKGIESANQSVQSFAKTYQKMPALSQAVDTLAHTIIDVANDIEAKFDDFILDYYKMTKARTDNLADKFAHLKKKKWAECIDKVLDAILICLDASIDPMVFSSLDTVTSYANRVKEKLDWNEDNTVSLNVPDIFQEWAEPITEPTVEELNWRQDAKQF